MAQRNPWDDDEVVRPGPIYTPIPQTPQQQREGARADRGEARSDRGEARSDRGDARDAAKFEFDRADKLRADYDSLPEVKSYRNAITVYSSALKTQPTPQGDLSLIYSFAKLMDPTSVVREREAASVAGTDTIAGQIEARLKKELGGGGTFSPEARNGLLREMQNRVAAYNDQYNLQRQRYQANAQAFGVDPARVIGPHDGDAFYNDIKGYWEKQGVPVVPSAQDEQGNPLPSGARVPQKPPQDYRSSYAGQGMSGINEGIAGTLGLPVDVATAALNLLPRGVNAAANTNLPTIQNPALGSQWLKDRMGGWGIYDQTNDPNKQFARRTAQSVGAAVPVAGAAGGARQALGGLLGSLGGGVGGATAQRVAPGNIGAEMAGELLGGGLATGGLLGSSRRSAQRQIESGIPTIDQLKQKAGEQYRSAESRGITAGPDMTKQLSENLRAVLQKEGRITPDGQITEVYPKVREAIRLTDGYAGQTMTPTQMQPVRSVIADGLTSTDATERRLGSLLTDTFDAWANPQAPELAGARNTASRYLNAQKLAQARELAHVREAQHTNAGLDNAIRTEYRALDRGAIKGGQRYGQTLGNAIENVSRGTPASNAAKFVGKFAPTSPMSTTLGMGAPAALGAMAFGPTVGALAGGTAAVLGSAGRMAANRMTLRNAEIAELIARNGGPIPQAPLMDQATQEALAYYAAAQAGKYTSPPRKKKPKRY